jgi:hypothetical protein
MAARGGVTVGVAAGKADGNAGGGTAGPGITAVKGVSILREGKRRSQMWRCEKPLFRTPAAQ